MFEMGISPDFPAFWCYGIVFLVGAWVAVQQISAQLADIPGIWSILRTYVLTLLYTCVPMGLFWLLDRGGALNDTSMFAAVFVGFGYKSIIAGKSDSIRAGSDLSGFWTPFQTYADSVVVKMRETIDRRRRSDEDSIIADIASTDAKYQKFKDYAQSHVPDQEGVRAVLASVQSEPASTGRHLDRETEIRRLYGFMMPFPALVDHVGKQHRRLNKRQVAWRWLAQHAAKFVIAAIVLMLGGGIYAKEYLRPVYILWRVGKANATAADQYRAREHIAELLRAKTDDAADVKRAKDMVESLGPLLRDPSLPMDRVDQILPILVRAGADGYWTRDIACVMIAALAVENSDIRRRVNGSLIAMAAVRSTGVPEELKTGNGVEAISLSEREARIQKWRRFWDTGKCEKPSD